MLRLHAISSVRFALAFGVAVGLAGCTSEPFVPTEPMALDGVTFTLEPEPQEHCDPNQPFAVKVQWDVIDWDVPRFDFRLGSSEGQLWARHNTARGEQTTELFGRPGLWFVMVDRESGLLVAANKVPPLVCPEAPKQP
jgi:hypothetical protein